MICLNTTDFVSLKKASEVAQVSKMTIWNYANKHNHIETRKNAQHKSVYRLQDVCESFGIDYCEQSQQDEKRVAIYGRVSSRQQCVDGNLDRQLDRLRDYVSQKWGVEPLEYSDVKSGFSDRESFNKLCSDIMDGKISIVVAEFADRTQRQSSGKALFEMICQKFNVQIIYIENAIPESAMNECLEELVAYVTCVCNRLSAQKQANRKRVDIDDAVLQRVDSMLKSGHSMKSAATELQREGIKGIKGQTISNQILGSRFKVWKQQQQRKAILTNGEIETERDAVDEWLDVATNRGSELKEQAKHLLDSWNAYAKANGHNQANIANFARMLKAKGFTNKRLGNGRMGWFGLELS